MTGWLNDVLLFVIVLGLRVFELFYTSVTNRQILHTNKLSIAILENVVSQVRPKPL